MRSLADILPLPFLPAYARSARAWTSRIRKAAIFQGSMRHLLLGGAAIAATASWLTALPSNSLSHSIEQPTPISTPPLIFKLPSNSELGRLERNISEPGRYAAMEAADSALSDYSDYFGSRELAPGEFVWRAEPSRRDSVHIVVSISEQRAYVYEGPILLAATTVSTGAPGHPTPVGLFPIIEKYELKLSNLYDEAPMHFMQRLTMDGIALHAGPIPGVPASHGCIRLPMEFAKKLYAVTSNGTPVLIAA